MFDDFKSYMGSYIGTYGNYYNVSLNTSKDIFEMIRDDSNKDLKKVGINKLNTGHFYLMRYNYNGNPVWCPILTIEYKVIKNKNIIYAINLEYIPPIFKVDFFNLLFKSYSSVLDKNQDLSILTQQKIPIKFDVIYRILKDAKKEYIITAYDIKKIKDLYLISTNLIPHFIMINTQKYNASSMKELYVNAKDTKEKLKLSKILEEYDNILKEYNINSDEYHKKLKSFEQIFKLYENQK